MKATSKTAVAAIAIAIATLANQAQAHTVIRLLPKSTIPYAVPHDEPSVEATVPTRTVRAAKHSVAQVRTAGKQQVIR